MGADAAFQQDRESARHQFGMTARNRYDAAFAELERDRSDVGGGISPPCDRLGRRRNGNFHGHQIAERYHPVGRIFAEAAYIANGKHIGGDVQGALGLRQGAYSVAADDDLGADTRQRRREFAPAEEERQGGDRHPGAQHAEHRQKILDRVGQVKADDGVGRQSHAPQPRREGADDAIGLRVAQAQRASAGEAGAIEWVDQRRSVGAALRVTAEDVVERQRRSA